MDRSELPDDDAEPFRPPLPPDDRLWRHPSEMGGAWAPPPRRSRAPRVVAAGAVGLLAVMVVAVWLVARDGNSDVAGSPGPTQATRTSASLPATTVPGTTVATTGAVTTLRRVTAPTPAPAPATATTPRTSTAASSAPATTAPSTPTSATPATTAPTATTAPLADGGPALARLVAVHGGQANVSTATVLAGGVLVTTEGAVGGATTFTVVLPDGTQVPAELLATDDESGVAVLRALGSEVPPATELGTAVEAKPGTTLAVASAVTPSTGSCTLKGMGADAVVAGRTLKHLLRLDGVGDEVADGDVVLDGRGRVIGIVAMDGGGQVMAVPIDLARSVARSVASEGRVVVPWLGVSGSDVDAVTAAAAGTEGGALVVSVSDGSPAAEAGLQQGDAIVALSGVPVRSMAALVLALRGHAPGDAVVVTYWRAGQGGETSVTLRARG